MRAALPLHCLLLLLLQIVQAQSQPEIISEGISFYSNEYVQTGMVKNLGNEKNIEEIYQFYTYYEAIYDARKRVTSFKEYQQGKVLYEEQYIYNGEGSVPTRKTVLIPGQEPKIIQLEQSKN